MNTVVKDPSHKKIFQSEKGRIEPLVYLLQNGVRLIFHLAPNRIILLTLIFVWERGTLFFFLGFDHIDGPHGLEHAVGFEFQNEKAC